MVETCLPFIHTTERHSNRMMCACVHSDMMRHLLALFDTALCHAEAHPAKNGLMKCVQLLGCFVKICVGLLGLGFLCEARLCGIWTQTSFFIDKRKFSTICSSSLGPLPYNSKSA